MNPRTTDAIPLELLSGRDVGEIVAEAAQDTGKRFVSREHILIVDDENGPRQALRILLKETFDVQLATNVDDALDVLQRSPIQLVITDIRMPKRSGVDLLKEIKKNWPEIQVIIITGYGQLSTAMQAVEYDAYAYLEKPFDNDQMLSLIRGALEKCREERQHRRLERLAVEANRFDTFGRIVSGMMHDLGTPLSVIGSHLELISMNPSPEKLMERVETMRAQVRHCNDLVRTAMGFLREKESEPAALDFNHVVRSCVDVAQPMLRGHQVHLDLQLSADLPAAHGDLVLVRQAIINLVNNACNAMEDSKPPKTIRIETWHDGDNVCVAIEDTGPGIPEALREHIFDAFFTTREGKGSGIGLSVVDYVMRRHHGSASLAHSTTGGARFVLSFPAGGRR